MTIQNKKLQKLPDSPGVYLFRSANGEVIYVGKAVNVRKRVSSYFNKSLVSGKTAVLVKKIAKIDTVSVTSELEALLLEASLIKRYTPFFNSRAKDDKNPLYIKVTICDTYPRVFLSRREEERDSIYFGPFPGSQTVKRVLQMLRAIFPFDTQKTIGKKPCFWSHIGLCNPCPSWIETLQAKQKKIENRRYKKNIKNLVRVLSRKTKSVEHALIREMTQLSKENKFEEAQVFRDQLKRLFYITEPYNKTSSFLENPNLVADIRIGEARELGAMLVKHGVRTKNLQRIECFDASHTALVSPTVGMVTFVDGEPDKNLYRKFRIRREESRDDLSFLEEALKRRFAHKEWSFPNLLIIDGGRGQVGRARKVLEEMKIKIPLIGLVKPFDDVVIPHKDGFQIVRLQGGPAQRLLQRLRDEAHRFSRAYHFNLRAKRFLG